ncbi:unnamed protein product [Lota lota]
MSSEDLDVVLQSRQAWASGPLNGYLLRIGEKASDPADRRDSSFSQIIRSGAVSAEDQRGVGDQGLARSLYAAQVKMRN